MKISHRSRSRKILVTAVLAIGLTMVGGAAYAGHAWSDFNVVMPRFQWQGLTGAQTKAQTGVDGQIQVASVGSSYKADAQMCSLNGLYCGGGTKVYGLNDNTSANMPNSYGAGVTGIRTSLQSNTWNAVTVQVIGSWRSR